MIGEDEPVLTSHPCIKRAFLPCSFFGSVQPLCGYGISVSELLILVHSKVQVYVLFLNLRQTGGQLCFHDLSFWARDLQNLERVDSIQSDTFQPFNLLCHTDNMLLMLI